MKNHSKQILGQTILKDKFNSFIYFTASDSVIFAKFITDI